MEKKLYLLLSFFLVTGLQAQAPDLAWQKLIGGNNLDFLQSIETTNDGGLIIGGHSRSNISGDKTENCFTTPSYNGDAMDYWVLKLDNEHNIEWQRTLGGAATNNNLTEQDFLSIVKQTADSGYIIGGSSNSGISGNKTEPCKGSNDYWIIKLNSEGIIEWQRTFGGNESDELSDLLQTTDEGYILAGNSWSSISGDKTDNTKGSLDGWIIKIDNSGNIQWQKTIGGNDYDSIQSVLQTPDGGYIFAATSYSPISGDKTEDTYGGNDYWIIKTNSTGSVEWQKTIGGNNFDDLKSIISTEDGGFLIGGNSDSPMSGLKTESFKGGLDLWIIKMNMNATIEWQKSLGGFEYEQMFRNSLLQNTDGSYIVVASSDSGISGDKTVASRGLNDCWIIKLADGGNLLSQKAIGGYDDDYINNIKKNTDNEIILGGFSYSSNTGDIDQPNKGIADYWILKLNPESLVTEHNNSLSQSVIWPNPTSGMVSLRLNSAQNFKLTLSNVLGQIIYIENFENKSTLNYSIKEASGIYFLKLENSDGESTVFKIVKN